MLVGVMLGSTPLLVYRSANPENPQIEASTIELKQFPGLVWSTPSKETVSVLLKSSGDEQELGLAEGEKSSAVSEVSNGSEIAAFYRKQFLDKGFTETKAIGDPNTEKYWVNIYRQNSQYAEVEYYPTPYQQDSYTIVVFYGLLKEE